MKTRCKQNSKIIYTKVEAQTYVNAHKSKQLRIYECPGCEGWHLTSKRKEPPAGEPKPLILAKRFLKYLSSE